MLTWEQEGVHKEKSIAVQHSVKAAEAALGFDSDRSGLTVVATLAAAVLAAAVLAAAELPAVYASAVPANVEIAFAAMESAVPAAVATVAAESTGEVG